METVILKRAYRPYRKASSMTVAATASFGRIRGPGKKFSGHLLAVSSLNCLQDPPGCLLCTDQFLAQNYPLRFVEA